jgi:hypothetical protein
MLAERLQASTSKAMHAIVQMQCHPPKWSRTCYRDRFLSGLAFSDPSSWLPRGLLLYRPTFAPRATRYTGAWLDMAHVHRGPSIDSISPLLQLMRNSSNVASSIASTDGREMQFFGLQRDGMPSCSLGIVCRPGAGAWAAGRFARRGGRHGWEKVWVLQTLLVELRLLGAPLLLLDLSSLAESSLEP